MSSSGALPRSLLTMTEDQGDGYVRLRVVGELDLATAPILEERLERLCERKLKVQLDLSSIEFIDSTGIRLLFRAVKEGREGGCPVEVDRDLAPQVKRVLGILHLEEFIVGAGSPARPTAGGPAQPG